MAARADAPDVRALAALASLLAGAPSAQAQPVVLRMAAVAPDGTAWAHEGRIFERSVDAATRGAVRVKWYFGGIAGDDVESGQRVLRGQLDGVVSGGMLCLRQAPTLQPFRVVGMFRSRNEVLHVLRRLKSKIDAELDHAGFVNLGTFLVGTNILFTRAPVQNLADLKRTRLFMWSLDQIRGEFLNAMHLNMVPLPLTDAARSYDEGRVDGFLSPPTAALAFQWSSRARYFTNLPVDYLVGCMLVSHRSFDQLAYDQQRAILEVAAKVDARLQEIGQRQDEELVRGLLEHQGVHPVPVSESFTADFFAAAREAREGIGARLVASEQLSQIFGWLADYRALEAEHAAAH
jgi:TRAP-type C4-dicarboxylate transport system substrate-binding protein